MRTTIRIARLELSTLFYSPIAWIIAIIFLFSSGLGFVSNLKSHLLNQQLGGEYLQYLSYLTQKIYVGSNGMFPALMGKLYLYLPLLTMGLISREVSSGTIKLLYSSPVKVKHIILGKFFAMMVYNVLLIFILALFAITGMFVIQSADGGLLFSSLLGILLLLCAYAAIGLFMSCLTSYQIVAAISTLAVFAFLTYIRQLWQEFDFVRDLTYFLSLSGRTDNMLFGLISTLDVLYFIIIISLFLAFSIIQLQAGRQTRSVSGITAKYLGALALALVGVYITSRPALIGYYDATADKTETVTPPTEKILKEIGDEPLEITSYVNLLDQFYQMGQPSQRNNDLDYWSRYTRFKPNIKFKYVYYYDSAINVYSSFVRENPGKTVREVAETYAKAYKTDLADFVSPEELKKTVNLVPENNRYVLQVKFKGKTTFLRLFDDPIVYPGEAEITAALKRLTFKVPRIAFLTGEFERHKERLGPTDYGTFTSYIVLRNTLINKGFDTETISLKEGEIPGDSATLVIGDPRAPFAPEVLAKIQKYIAEGGNLLIAGEPGKQSIINPLIQPLGVQMMDGMLLEKSKNFKIDMVLARLTSTTAGFSKYLQNTRNDSIGISMPGVTGLTYTANGPFDIKPLLMSNPAASWRTKNPVVLDSADINYAPQNGDDNRSVPTMLALTRKVNGKQQRIIISADADFMTDGAASMGQNANFLFSTQLFRWLTYGQFPIDDSRPNPKDIRLNITATGLSALRIVFLVVLPALFIAFAAILLIRRKRK